MYVCVHGSVNCCSLIDYIICCQRGREREGGREGGEKRETDESGRALSGFIFENGQASPAVYL